MATIDCLNTLVGIYEGCTEQITSDSTLFLSDLPEISVKNINAALTQENLSAITEVQTQIKEAAKLMAQDIQVLMMPKFKGISVVENKTVGTWNDDLDAKSGSANTYRGVEFEIFRHNSFLKFFVSRIGVHLQNSGAVNVDIIDLIQGKVLQTVAVTAVADTPTYVDAYVELPNDKQKQHLFIGIDNADYYDTDIAGAQSGCRGCGNYGWNSKYVAVRAKTLPSNTALIDDNLSGSRDTGGLSVGFSLACDLEQYICNVRNVLAVPMRYKLANLIVRRIRYSKRLNSIVFLYEDDHDSLAAFYDAQYKEGLSKILQQLNPTDSLCFTCNRRVFTRVAIP